MSGDLKVKEHPGKLGCCPACGAALEENDIFCSECGCRLTKERGEDTPPKLSWEKKINLFTDKHVFKGLSLALGGGVGFVFLLLLILSLADGTFDWGFFRTLLLIVLALFGILAVLIPVAMLILGGWRYPYRFTVDKDGVFLETAPEQRRKNTFLNSLGFVLGLLSKDPGAMGAAILAQSRQSEFYGWKDIRLVKPDPRGRSIVLKLSRGRTSVLWCPPERYEEILRAVLTWHKSTEPQRRKKAGRKKGSKGFVWATGQPARRRPSRKNISL